MSRRHIALLRTWPGSVAAGVSPAKFEATDTVATTEAVRSQSAAKGCQAASLTRLAGCQRAGSAKLADIQRWRLVVFLLLLWPVTAFAHTRGGEAIGFVSGFEHPISGIDHVLAMVAVGLWGAQLGPPAVWLLPVTFPMVMAFGGMLGLMGLKLPGVEVCIALSAIALGLMVLREAKPNLLAAAFLVGFFAIFHGHAHGTELPVGANGLLYSLGFVIATGLLHATGIAIGTIHRWPKGRVVLRVAGAVVMAGGAVFLWGALT